MNGQNDKIISKPKIAPSSLYPKPIGLVRVAKRVENITSPLTIKPAMNLLQDLSIVHYESEDEKEDSDWQLLWNRIMDEGKYKTSSTYKKVEVLVLCWETQSSDLPAIKKEVQDLQAIFENRFNYHTEINYLNTTAEHKLQIRVNKMVAAFVDEHDGPDTLLIVYYAGHGRPGAEYGDLELFGFAMHAC